jgi:hypothetical protein
VPPIWPDGEDFKFPVTYVYYPRPYLPYKSFQACLTNDPLIISRITAAAAAGGEKQGLDMCYGPYDLFHGYFSTSSILIDNFKDGNISIFFEKCEMPLAVKIGTVISLQGNRNSNR